MKAERAAQRLEAIMARHDTFVLRTLADLRRSGFGEISIEGVYQRLDAQREYSGFTQAEIDHVLYVMRKRARERKRELEEASNGDRKTV